MTAGEQQTGEMLNPVAWYYHEHEDAEWWHRGGSSRSDAIRGGKAEYDGRPFWIVQAKSMVPSFSIFDGDDICDRLNDDDVWWEDGWTGEPDRAAKIELEVRLAATLKAWFAEFATLDGACLDQLSTEFISGEKAAAS